LIVTYEQSAVAVALERASERGIRFDTQLVGLGVVGIGTAAVALVAVGIAASVIGQAIFSD